MSPFFEQLVAQCGLSPLFARRSIERACARAGIVPTKLQRSDLPTLLPILEQTLKMYLGADEAERRLQVIEALGR